MEYVAIQLSGTFEKGGFKTSDDAWDWIMNNECDDCKKSGIHACSAEWDVETREQLDKWKSNKS